jgi:hypothetical protein
MLGEVGRQMLYFYEANALPINLVLITYGLFLLLSWLTLVRIYRFIVVALAKRIHLHPDLNRKSTVKKIRDTVGIPWQEAVDAANFPLIAPQGALLPKRKSVSTVQFWFDENDIIRDAFAVLDGTDPRRIAPRYSSIRKRELRKDNQA